MNTCLRALRRKLTQEAWELGQETAYPPEISGDDDDPEEAALASERRNEVLAALRHVTSGAPGCVGPQAYGGPLLRRDSRGARHPGRDGQGLGQQGPGRHARSPLEENYGGDGTRRRPSADAGEPGGNWEALQKTGACAEGKRAYLSSAGVPMATCSDIDPPVSTHVP